MRTPTLLKCSAAYLLLQVMCLPASAVVRKAGAAKKYYFWNEVTGDKQWEDPGDVAYEDEARHRYWLTDTGHRVPEDLNSLQYVWVELYSEEVQQPYYYNQVTEETTWVKPPDLAWRRVPVR